MIRKRSEGLFARRFQSMFWFALSFSFYFSEEWREIRIVYTMIYDFSRRFFDIHENRK